MSFARYPAYKDSGVDWLGEVPAHWDVLGIKRVCAVVGGSTPKSDQEAYWDGDIVWVTPADLSRLIGFEISDSLRTITSEGLASCGTTLVPQGSVVLSTRAPIGSLGIAAKELCTNQGCKALVPNDIGTRFLAYVLTASNEALNFRGKGTTFLELSGDELAAFQIPLPLSSEQAAIATFLDRETAKIDALVAEQERLIALLKEKRQAVISHAVTKGLDPSVPMMDSGVEWLGEVPAHWEVRPIRRASTFVTSGPRGWSDFISEEGTLFVQSGDLDDEQNVLWQSAKRVNLNQADLAEAARTRLLEGDVVVCITGAKTGNVAIVRDVTEPAHINQHLCLIRPTAEVRAAFMGRYLASETGQRFLLLAQYGLKQGLGLDDIKSVSMPVPPVDEQDEIALTIDHLSGQMNQLMSHAQTVIATLQERRSALISAAVTGQIDVRGAPEQAP